MSNPGYPVTPPHRQLDLPPPQILPDHDPGSRVPHALPTTWPNPHPQHHTLPTFSRVVCAETFQQRGDLFSQRCRWFTEPPVRSAVLPTSRRNLRSRLPYRYCPVRQLSVVDDGTDEPLLTRIVNWDSTTIGQLDGAKGPSEEWKLDYRVDS
ncbi:MAG TPA: hypothetical protein VFQ48_02920 [Pseudonocardiaceae bacterium]|nr:hypothetical protein [Pseudonocardiaceae bacterium]